MQDDLIGHRRQAHEQEHLWQETIQLLLKDFLWQGPQLFICKASTLKKKQAEEEEKEW